MIHINSRVLGVLILSITLIFSCKKLPEPSFSYKPTENPEAGETLEFKNLTLNATSYEWDFGDTQTSTLENPEHIYEVAGIYGVKLTAYNESGDNSIIQSVTINEPTILSFSVYDSTGENVISGAIVELYASEDDLMNLQNKLATATTDNMGEVEFRNMEAVVYYVLAYKSVLGGMWLFAHNTPTLELNQENNFFFLCEWFPDIKKSVNMNETFILKSQLRNLHAQVIFPH